jgi:hypothetical protein
MSPSTTARRAGVVTASAMALCLGGAFTAGSASALTICPLGQILSSTGKCVQKTVTSVIPTTPPTTSSGSGSGGGGIKLPLPSLPVPLPSSGGSSGSGGSSSGGSGGGLHLPNLPGLPNLGGVTSGSGTGGTGGLTGPTVPGSKGTPTATNDGSSVPGSQPGAPGSTPTAGGGMLGPASAYLPAGDILGFTNFSGTGGAAIPTSSNLADIPSPLLANQPASQLAAVQAPLLAAGEDAGRGGTVLAAFGSYALPGLLVVLATAVVATVGAGNIRVWQARLAARRS